MPKARTVADVILGEAVSGSPAKRYADMKAIASVISNRARALGVTPEQVVSNQREFNAYGKSLPAGVSAYRSMAEQALQDVSTNGPVHSGTFYATPAAAGNLPSGLQQETATSGHVYYSDPLNRAIGTSVGYRQPQAQTATQAIEGILSPQPQTATVNERMGLMNAYSAPQERQLSVPARSVQTTSYARPEAPASLDTLRQQQPAPPQSEGLLGQDVAYQGLINGLNAQKAQLAAPQTPVDQFAQAGTLAKTGRMPGPTPEGLLSQDVAYQGLINGLNAQKTQLAAGVNPMDMAEPWKAPVTQPMPTVDVPEVSPMTTASVAGPAQMGLLAPQLAPRDVEADQALAAQVAKGIGRSKMVGGMGGGLLGGLFGGPLGALAGGLLGRSVGARSYYPPAPSSPNPAQNNSTNTGRAGLSGAGRDIYDRSQQVRDAVDSGRPGLY